MEPQGGGKRPADKLQGAVVQDQAVQSQSTAKAVRSRSRAKSLTQTTKGTAAPSPAASEPAAPVSERVVVQFGNRTIKGYLESPAWNTIEELLGAAPRTSPERFRIRGHETGAIEDISTADVKAVFY